MYVLRDIDATGAWSRENWLRDAERGYSGRFDVASALAEAWAWLERTGLVAIGVEKYFVTRLGKRVLSDGLEPLKAMERLTTDLHPQVDRRVRSQYLLGEYELAAFAAMKFIEVRVRELSDRSPSDIGVKLMRDAFGEKGPLRTPGLDPGEQTARMELFAGAIGLFKNPTSHRDIELDDATEASEVILFADLLARILDRIEQQQS